MKDKKSVLLVDDNTNLCKTMSFVLERKGYEVNIAGDGNAALDKVKEQMYDVIFMDIKMPGMDGVETFKKIKKIRPGVSVVMMTAYAVSDLVQEALQEGARAVMYKPLDMEDVLTRIEEFVGASTRSDKGRATRT
jgi:two-component system response regulator HydG